MTEGPKGELTRRAYVRIPNTWDSMTEAEKRAASLKMAKEMQRQLKAGRRPPALRPDGGSV